MFIFANLGSKNICRSVVSHLQVISPCMQYLHYLHLRQSLIDQSMDQSQFNLSKQNCTGNCTENEIIFHMQESYIAIRLSAALSQVQLGHLLLDLSRHALRLSYHFLLYFRKGSLRHLSDIANSQDGPRTLFGIGTNQFDRQTLLWIMSSQKQWDENHWCMWGAPKSPSASKASRWLAVRRRQSVGGSIMREYIRPEGRKEGMTEKEIEREESVKKWERLRERSKSGCCEAGRYSFAQKLRWECMNASGWFCSDDTRNDLKCVLANMRSADKLLIR